MERSPLPEPTDERRMRLRRLDDLLEALETLNLIEASHLPAPVARRLEEMGVSSPEKKPISALIDDVLTAQEEFMVKLDIPRPERRLSQRRPMSSTVNSWLKGRTQRHP